MGIDSLKTNDSAILRCNLRIAVILVLKSLTSFSSPLGMLPKANPTDKLKIIHIRFGLAKSKLIVDKSSLRQFGGWKRAKMTRKNRIIRINTYTIRSWYGQASGGY